MAVSSHNPTTPHRALLLGSLFLGVAVLFTVLQFIAKVPVAQAIAQCYPTYYQCINAPCPSDCVPNSTICPTESGNPIYCSFPTPPNGPTLVSPLANQQFWTGMSVSPTGYCNNNPSRVCSNVQDCVPPRCDQPVSGRCSGGKFANQICTNDSQCNLGGTISAFCDIYSPNSYACNNNLGQDCNPSGDSCSGNTCTSQCGTESCLGIGQSLPVPKTITLSWQRGNCGLFDEPCSGYYIQVWNPSGVSIVPSTYLAARTSVSVETYDVTIRTAGTYYWTVWSAGPYCTSPRDNYRWCPNGNSACQHGTCLNRAVSYPSGGGSFVVSTDSAAPTPSSCSIAPPPNTPGSVQATVTFTDSQSGPLSVNKSCTITGQLASSSCQITHADNVGNSTTITCYRNGAPDTTFPEIVDFRLTSPNPVTLPNKCTFTMSVNDGGGSLLNRVEVYRKPQGGVWPATPLHTFNSINTNSWSVTNWVDASITNPGTYTYGIHAVDNAGNCTTEGGTSCSGAVSGGDAEASGKLLEFLGAGGGAFAPIDCTVLAANSNPVVNDFIAPYYGWNNGNSLQYSARVSDPDGGPVYARFNNSFYTVNGASVTSGGVSTATGTISGCYQNRTMTVTAVDPQNATSVVVVNKSPVHIDSVNPNTPVFSAPSSTPKATNVADPRWTWSATDSCSYISHYSVWVERNGVSCADPIILSTGSLYLSQAPSCLSQGDGTYRLTVQAFDIVGNASATAYAEWVWDRVSPVVTIDSFGYQPAGGGSYANITNLANIPANGRCTVGDGDVRFATLCGPNNVCIDFGTTPCTSSGTWSKNFNWASAMQAVGTGNGGLDGVYDFGASQTDAAGNIGSATRQVIRDTVAPTVTRRVKRSATGTEQPCNTSPCPTDSNTPSFVLAFTEPVGWSSSDVELLQIFRGSSEIMRLCQGGSPDVTAANYFTTSNACAFRNRSGFSTNSITLNFKPLCGGAITTDCRNQSYYRNINDSWVLKINNQTDLSFIKDVAGNSVSGEVSWGVNNQAPVITPTINNN